MDICIRAAMPTLNESSDLLSSVRSWNSDWVNEAAARGRQPGSASREIIYSAGVESLVTNEVESLVTNESNTCCKVFDEIVLRSIT